MKLNKVMLVSSEADQAVESCLINAGCDVVRVAEGADAVSRILRETFDAAVLVSTGKKMDLGETLLNLSDIRDSMQIIIVDDRADGKYEMFARVIPKATVLTLKELDNFLRGRK